MEILNIILSWALVRDRFTELLALGRARLCRGRLYLVPRIYVPSRLGPPFRLSPRHELLQLALIQTFELNLVT